MNNDYTNSDNFFSGDLNDEFNLTEKEEKQLILLIRDPESSSEDIQSAKGLLIKSMEKSVRFYASYYAGFTMAAKEDLEQEGRSGVLEAIDKYSFNMGTRFSSYAVYWVRQKIQRLAEKENKCGNKGVGRVKREQFGKIKKTEEMFHIIRGEYTYTPEGEVAEASGFGVKKVREFRNQSGLSEVSLNRELPCSDVGKKIELGDTLCSDYSEPLEEELRGEIKTEAKKSVWNEIGKFSESDQRILEIYIQNDCGRGSFKIIAEKLGMTRELAAKSLKKLLRKLGKSPALAKVFNENYRA